MKKYHRNTALLLLVSLFLVAPAVVYAQEDAPALTYTLDECIDIALKRSPDILTAAEEIKRTTAYIFENWASVLSVSADGTYSFVEPSGIGSSSYEKYNVGLNASIPLFTGGRTVRSLNIAYLQREIAREQYRYAVGSTIYGTRVAFYSILLAEEQFQVWTEEVDVLDRNLEITKKNFMNGLAPKYDVNRIEVALANARTSLIQARNDLTIAYDNLKDILDLDLDRPITIEGELVFNPRDRGLEEYLSAAETRSPEISVKKLAEQVAAKNVLVAVGSYFPTISAFASYDTSSLNDLSVSFNGRDWDFTGGLTISIPISDLAVTAAKHKEAKALYEEAKIDTRDTEKSVKLSIRKAYFDLEEAKEIIGLQESNVALAQENLERSELRYVNGVETLLDLLDARLAVTNAQLNYINAIYGYEESIARLNMIMGDGQTGQ
ncbi:MAG: TolC family protein [Deltaproteobacteria bacterium]|nr:TolC family protein [Candidatus Zymogenaceae bacterium]